MSHVRNWRQADHESDFRVVLWSDGRHYVEHGGAHRMAYVEQIPLFGFRQNVVDGRGKVVYSHFVPTIIRDTQR